MNYRHAFHAGNFADVHKHLALTLVLHHLREKEAAFRVLDTHAGAGLYNLAGAEAAETQEWRGGIGRLLATRPSAEAEPLLRPYLDAVGCFNEGGETRRYPGSAALALSLLRPQDRLLACEIVPEAEQALAAQFGRDKRAKALALDGWTALGAFVPPKERRGLVLIDPPYEAAKEFARVAQQVIAAHRKWAAGIFLIWYPLTARARPDVLVEDFARAGIPKILRAELSLGETAGGPGLSGSGLIVINPPWRLRDQLAVAQPALARILAPDRRGGARLDWLAP